MTVLKGNCLVAQSGGPTSVINASVCGIVQEAFRSGEIDRVYGALHGVAGILNEDLICFNDEPAEEIELMRVTPAAALGSCRFKLGSAEESKDEFKRILEVFEAHNIRYFFYVGGNDSMDTACKVSAYALKSGYQLRAIGVPKTVDNDLPITDHTPGFGSAAKYIATTLKEVSLDAKVYDYPTVTICELMGRNAGWITASAALARDFEGDAPHYIYLPEVPFSLEQFDMDVRAAIAKYNFCVIAFSEGVKTADGKYIAELGQGKLQKDSFGHSQLGGACDFLVDYVQKNITKKARSVNFSTTQRAAAHWASLTDNEEAYTCGQKAVRYAIEGHTSKMVGIFRVKSPDYKIEFDLVNLDDVANKEKKVPRKWINEVGNDVTKELVDYIRPLIIGEVRIRMEDGVARYSRLKKNIIEKKLKAFAKK